MQESNAAQSEWQIKQSLRSKVIVLCVVGFVLILVMCMPEVEIKNEEGEIVKPQVMRERNPVAPQGIKKYLHDSVAARVADWQQEGVLYYGYDYSGRLINVLDYEPAPNIITPFDWQVELYYIYSPGKEKVIIKHYEPSWRAGSLCEQEKEGAEDCLTHEDIYEYDVVGKNTYLMQVNRYDYNGDHKLSSEILRNRDYSIRQVRAKNFDHADTVAQPDGSITADGWYINQGANQNFDLWDIFGKPYS